MWLVFQNLWWRTRDSWASWRRRQWPPMPAGVNLQERREWWTLPD